MRVLASKPSIRRASTHGCSGSRARIRSADMVRMPANFNLLQTYLILDRFPVTEDVAAPWADRMSRQLRLAAAAPLAPPLLRFAWHRHRHRIEEQVATDPPLLQSSMFLSCICTWVVLLKLNAHSLSMY